MGLISFFKEAGEKLFGKKVQEVQAAPSKADPAVIAEANREAATAIEKYINTLGLTVTLSWRFGTNMSGTEDIRPPATTASPAPAAIPTITIAFTADTRCRVRRDRRADWLTQACRADRNAATARSSPANSSV